MEGTIHDQPALFPPCYQAATVHLGIFRQVFGVFLGLRQRPRSRRSQLDSDSFGQRARAQPRLSSQACFRQLWANGPQLAFSIGFGRTAASPCSAPRAWGRNSRRSAGVRASGGRIRGPKGARGARQGGSAGQKGARVRDEGDLRAKTTPECERPGCSVTKRFKSANAFPGETGPEDASERFVPFTPRMTAHVFPGQSLVSEGSLFRAKPSPQPSRQPAPGALRFSSALWARFGPKTPGRSHSGPDLAQLRPSSAQRPASTRHLARRTHGWP